MKRFTIESDENKAVIGKADEQLAVIYWDEKGEIYSALHVDGEDYIYEHKNYQTGMKVKKVRIPFDILMDLPALLHMLNVGRDHRIMAPTRIYQQGPIADLFQKEKNR